MKKASGGHVCAVTSCKNNSLKSKESFFGFPSNKNRAKVWAMACNREDLLDRLDMLCRSHRVCGSHFEPKMFLNYLRNRLKPHAVPTVLPSFEESSKELTDHNYAFFIPSKVPEEIPADTDPTATLSDVDTPIIESAVTEEDYEGVKILPSMPIQDSDERQRDNNILVSSDLSTPRISNSGTDPMTRTCSTQTPSFFSSHRPRKEKLRAHVKSLKNKIVSYRRQVEEIETNRANLLNGITLEEYKTLTYKFCSKELAQLVNIEILQT